MGNMFYSGPTKVIYIQHSAGLFTVNFMDAPTSKCTVGQLKLEIEKVHNLKPKCQRIRARDGKVLSDDAESLVPLWGQRLQLSHACEPEELSKYHELSKSAKVLILFLQPWVKRRSRLCSFRDPIAERVVRRTFT